MGSLNTKSQLIVEEIQGDTLTPISDLSKAARKKEIFT